jgi:hypothetical protein
VFAPTVMGKFINMQKVLIAILFSLSSLGCLSQERHIGKFSGYPGVLEIKEDSTYYYSWAYDFQTSWSVGVWRSIKDTLFLINTPIYDTIYYDLTEPDSFKTILSLDQVGEEIDSVNYALNVNSIGGQNKHLPPTKLFLKRNILYFIINGELDRSKAFSVLGQRSYPNNFKKL